MTSSETYRRRQRQGHLTANAAGVAAGTVGAAFGSAKLRDSYREQYPHSFRRGLHAVERVTTNAGMPQQARSKLLRVVSRSHPGFKSLAVATAAGATAAGAQKYEQHARAKARAARRQELGKSAFGIDHDLSKADRRRRAGEAAAAGASAGLTVSANRDLQRSRALRVEGAEVGRRSAEQFHAAREQGNLVHQRLARHAVPVGEPRNLPPRKHILANTARAHSIQQGHIDAGIELHRQAQTILSTGRKVKGRAKGKLGAAVAIGAGAAALRGSRKNH